MSEIATNPVNGYQSWTPMYNYPASQQQTQPSVALTTPQGQQIYQYPQTSIYNDPNKQAASGVNIYIYNPSGIGAPSTINNESYGIPQPQQNAPLASTPIANTPISQETNTKSEPKKTKNVVKLTDDYIKTTESFLRSKDSTVRKQAIQDIVKRFEEDDSRYDNAALTALLNIALQDPDVHNRMIALSVIASGGAHGDQNTIQLLNGLKSSDKMYGQEAKLATNSLLKTSQTREKIADNSPEEPDALQKEMNKMYEMK